MGKLITLKDRITGESIYPNIPVTAVINEENGSNILGEVESQIRGIDKSLNTSLSNITTSLDKIKKLEGLDASKEEKELALNIVRIQENKRNLETLQIQNSDINNKLNDYIEKSEVLKETDIIEKVTDQFDNRAYIRSGGAPTSAPNRRQIRIGTDGHLYVGIGKLWYKSIKTFTAITPTSTTSLEETIITINIDTDWINNIYIWDDNDLLFTTNNSSNTVSLPQSYQNLSITVDFVYEADNLRIYNNDTEITEKINQIDDVYYNIFNNINSGDILELRTRNSSIEKEDNL